MSHLRIVKKLITESQQVSSVQSLDYETAEKYTFTLGVSTEKEIPSGLLNPVCAVVESAIDATVTIDLTRDTAQPRVDASEESDTSEERGPEPDMASLVLDVKKHCPLICVEELEELSGYRVAQVTAKKASGPGGTVDVTLYYN